MKKKIGYIILFGAVIGLAFTLLENRASQDTDLAEKFDTLFEAGDTQIDLTAFTDFKWTQVAVFEPYTPIKMIEDSMEIKFKGNNGAIDILDDRFLLVFADDKYAIKTVVLSKNYGSYSIKDHTILNVEQQLRTPPGS